MHIRSNTQHFSEYAFKNNIDSKWDLKSLGILLLLRMIDKLAIVLDPTGSPSRGGDVAVYVFDINQPSLSTPFYSVLVSLSVFMALSTVFHSINSPDSSPLSHFVLPVLFLPYWSFHYVSLYESFSQP